MDATCPISTAQVPARWLKTAMLTGSTPLKALHSDPRVSYSLYIPPSHYNPDPNRIPSLEGKGSDLPNALPRLPLVIAVHGTGRDSGSSRRRLIPLADTSRCAVLAPLFPAGLDDEYDLDSYKLLRSKTLKSDLVLFDMIAEVAARYPGVDTEKFFLVGFSGGGQFVHRFLYLHPERVLAASVGAPGRVTRLDRGLKWPQGIANVQEVFGAEREVSFEEIRKIKAIQMVVGGDDTKVPGNDFHEWVAKMKGGRDGKEDGDGNLQPMRTGRVDTLRTLHEEWQSLGISSTFEVVEGIKHDANGVNDVVVQFLEPMLKDWWSNPKILEPNAK